MDQTYDEQIEQGILTVEKTTIEDSDGKQISAIKTTTILEPEVFTIPLKDVQRRLDEFKDQRSNMANSMATLDNLIDYHGKLIANYKK